MKHVRLPIFDEEGFALEEDLHVSVEILQRLAAMSTIYKDHVKVVPHPKPTPEEEIEAINDIIDGRPLPSKFRSDYYPFPRPKSSAHFLVEGDKVVEVTRPEDVAFLPIDAVEITKGRLESVSVDVDGFGSVELVDVVSRYPKEFFEANFPPLEKPDGLDYDTVQSRWRRIPGFNAYRMSPTKHICDDNHMSVSIVKGGRIDNVLLTNDDGITKRMSVDFLFSKTFPEL